jgi:hypothetical protein
MTPRELALPPTVEGFTGTRLLLLACFGLCVGQGVYLASSWFFGQWIVDPNGRGIPTDFVNVWAAGRLVLESHAADAYDWAIHKQVENGAVGYNFSGHYGWHYPPPFLAVAALLALLPYATAYALWVAITLPPYIAAVRWIVNDRIGYLIAGAFPAVLSNAMVGQNGFLTASLIGGTLGFLDRRPVVAGCCLGLLSYKPHFGILFPLVFALTGRWTVLITAAIVATAMMLSSWALFGIESWEAFFRWLPATSKAFLSDGHADFAKLQSVFGAVRAAGGGEGLAWLVHGSVAAVAAIAVCLLWRSKQAFELKAAALATGVLLMTPYVYLYDMVVLAIAVAFFLRHATLGGIRTSEYFGLAAMAALLIIFPLVKLPVGLAATFVVAVMIANRCLFAPEPALPSLATARNQ